MEKGAFIRFFFLAAGIFLLGACAKVMPLSGGDQDSEPPQYRSSKPDTFATGFAGNTISIRFSEYITLKDPTREIFISPPPASEPEYVLSGQGVKIKFKDSLRKDFTYIINFGKALADITEGNVNTGYRFVFSTGNAIDSGSVTGFVSDAFSSKPAEGFKVMLYEVSVTDSFPYKEKPLYLTYTGADGLFRFENLRKGSYRLFALKEENNTFTYDRPGEEISFKSDLINTEDSTMHNLVCFTESSGLFSVQKAKAVSPIKIEVLFSGKAEKIEASPLFGFEENSFFASELNLSGDSLIIWHNPVKSDSLGIILQGLNQSDTIVIKTVKTEPATKPGIGRKGGGPTAAVPFVRFSAAGNEKADRFSIPHFLFNEPPQQIDTSKILLLADSVPFPYTWEYNSQTFPRKINLIFTNPVKTKKWILICDSAAFTGISGKISEKQVFAFAFRPESEYADIKVTLEDSLTLVPRIWQLLKQETVIRELFTSAEKRSVTFEKMEPGSYRLRMIEDVNENKKWDTGSYPEKRQPEKVFYLIQPLELKPGWDSEVLWKMNAGRKFKK